MLLPSAPSVALALFRRHTATSTAVPWLVGVTASLLMATPAWAASSTTTLASSASTAYVGNRVTLTATIARSWCVGCAIKGSVSFRDGSTLLGTVAVPWTLSSSTSVSFAPTAFDAVGNRSYTATYVTTTSVDGSTSQSVPVVIKDTTKSTLGVTPNPSQAGQSVTLSAAVAPIKGTVKPTGTVEFLDGTQSLGSKSLDANGAASLVTSALSAGSHGLRVRYPSTTYFDTSSSTITNLTVNPNPVGTSTGVSVSPATAREGDWVTVLASVSGGSPTGMVTFKDGTDTLGQAVVSGGVAQIKTILKSQGTHNITANYAGDAGTMPSISTVLPVSVSGRSYYFDQGSTTSDAGAGYADQPFASFSKLANRKLYANDRVLLKCGTTWRDQLTLNSANASDAGTPVVIEGWGSNCGSARPVINAAVPVVGSRWTKEGGREYWYQFTDAELPKASDGETLLPIRQLFRDVAGQITILPMARYPNAGYLLNAITTPIGSSGGADYLTTDDADHAYFSSLNGGASQALTGAEVHVRTAAYRIEDRMVGAYASTGTRGVLTFAAYPSDEYPRAPTGLELRAGYGYVLSGKDWMLDSDFEWTYNPTTKMLKLVVPSGVSPADLVIEASAREHGVSVADVPVQMQAVEVRYAAQEGIALDAAPGSLLSNVRVLYSGRNGVGIDVNRRDTAGKSHGTQIVASTVAFSGMNGISSHGTFDMVVTNNVVTDTGIASAPASSECGICIEWGSHAVIRNNMVQRSAYLGIRYPNIDNSEVVANLVEDACTLLDDCGGIYTYSGDDTQAEWNQGSVVQDNVVRRLVGEAMQGTPNKQLVAVAGIYIDDLSRNVTVANNTVTDTDTGLYLHNNRNVVAQGNSFTAVRSQCITVGHGLREDLSSFTVGDLQILDNLCAPGVKSGMYAYDDPLPEQEDKKAVAVSVLDSEQPLSAANIVFSGNRYIPLYGPVRFFVSNSETNGERRLDMVGWRALTAEAPASNQHEAPWFKRWLVTNLGAELFPNGTFTNESLTGWDTTSAVVRYDSAVCGGSPCGGRPASSTSSNVFSVSGSFVPDELKTYLFKYRLSTPTGPDRIMVNIGLHCNGQYDSGAGYRVAIRTPHAAWMAEEMPVAIGGLSRCGTNAKLVRLSLRTPWADPVTGTVQTELLFDDISLVPATISMNPLKDDVLVVSNLSAVSQAVACPVADVTRCQQYVDINRTPVSFPLSLQPNSAKALFWTGSGYYIP